MTEFSKVAKSIVGRTNKEMESQFFLYKAVFLVIRYRFIIKYLIMLLLVVGI
jgi:hypothetical protein